MDVGHHGLRLGRLGAIEVEVVDEQLRFGINGPRRVESERDKVLSEKVEEDRLAEGTILVENLIHNILLPC